MGDELTLSGSKPIGTPVLAISFLTSESEISPVREPTTSNHSAQAETAAARLRPEEAAKITRNMALLSTGVALLLVLLKSGAWASSGSIAMLSSLADSGLDLAASLVTFLAVRYAATPPDSKHRFGHGKAEAFAGIFQAGLVAVSAALIVAEAVSHLINPVPITGGALNLAVMAVSIVATGLLVTAQSRAIRKTGSIATKGDRVHYFADFAANIATMAGIAAASYLNWAWADPVTGILIAIWLALSARQVAKAAADHLMDREMPDSDRERIRTLALEDPRLRDVHDLRTRFAGPYIHIQFHAALEPTLTLEAAHEIIVAAEMRIRAEFPAADVIIHPDPQNRSQPHGLEHFGEQVHRKTV